MYEERSAVKIQGAHFSAACSRSIQVVNESADNASIAGSLEAARCGASPPSGRKSPRQRFGPQRSSGAKRESLDSKSGRESALLRQEGQGKRTFLVGAVGL
jgi:hypothetical protein